MSLLTIEHLSKSYKADIPSLDDVSAHLEKGEILAVVGESGSGKSTLLKLIAGLVEPDSGEIKKDGHPLDANPAKRGVGMVFQDYALFPHLTVDKNISFGNQLGRSTQELMAQVGITDQSGKLPGELSGGQQQRVAIARALKGQPDILLLDEPFSNLDEVTRRQLITSFKAELLQQVKGVIFVTHNVEDALMFADRILVLQSGKVIGQGLARDLYYSPTTSYCADLFGRANYFQLDQELKALGIAPVDSMNTLVVRPDALVVSDNGLAVSKVVTTHGQGITYFNGQTDAGNAVCWTMPGWHEEVASACVKVSGPFQWIK